MYRSTVGPTDSRELEKQRAETINAGEKDVAANAVYLDAHLLFVAKTFF